ncbi:AEC family transporter [Salinispirillum sp. LH 10-3-1]|uniref:AEC family transporter n=1 Tax=Salinispirillum sp. LH 10-3-1 TaxID=2952525 RepID=A0AB38YD48_9GAMM
MWPLINALGPVFLVILLGVALRRLAFPTFDFWPQLERLVYFVLFPAMLVSELATADFSGLAVSRVLLAVLGMLAVMTVVTIVLKPVVSKSGTQFTSVFQGGMRFNSFIVLAVASELFGSSGLALAAVIMALMIPLLNVLCVSVFAFYAGDERASVLSTVAAIGKNPLILGCVAGIVLNVTGIGLPGWSRLTVEILARSALPLGLLAVGVALNLDALRAGKMPLVYASLLKFVAMPLVAIGFSVLLGLSVQEQSVLLLFAAMPTATSAYILARQLGGDAPLMAAIITAQTLLAMLVLPVILFLNQMLFGGA